MRAERTVRGGGGGGALHLYFTDTGWEIVNDNEILNDFIGDVAMSKVGERHRGVERCGHRATSLRTGKSEVWARYGARYGLDMGEIWGVQWARYERDMGILRISIGTFSSTQLRGTAAHSSAASGADLPATITHGHDRMAQRKLRIPYTSCKCTVARAAALKDFCHSMIRDEHDSIE